MHQWRTLRPANVIEDSKYSDTFVTELSKQEIHTWNKKKAIIEKQGELLCKGVF